MTARELGTLGDAGEVAGDTQLGTAYGRRFLTVSPAGFPVVLEVSACPAYVSPGAPDDGDMRRDVLEVTWQYTYLHGIDPAELEAGEAEPFDSECTYAWPIDYWPASALGADGEPTDAAMDATARAHVAGLSPAWLGAMPTPPASADGATHSERNRA